MKEGGREDEWRKGKREKEREGEKGMTRWEEVGRGWEGEEGGRKGEEGGGEGEGTRKENRNQTS